MLISWLVYSLYILAWGEDAIDGAGEDSFYMFIYTIAISMIFTIPMVFYSWTAVIQIIGVPLSSTWGVALALSLLEVYVLIGIYRMSAGKTSGIVGKVLPLPARGIKAAFAALYATDERKKKHD